MSAYHRSPFHRSILALTVASLAASGPAAEPQAAAAKGKPQSQPQAPPAVPIFSSEVQLITVDAVVLDKQHRPVPGLTRDDFVVTEDGRPVEIVSFEAFAQPESEPEEEPAAPSPVATNAPRSKASGRAFAVLVDDLNTLPEHSADARSAVRAFLETGLRNGDEVVVGTTSGDIWWTGRIPEARADLLSALERTRGKYEERFSFNQMTEYEAYRIANYEDSPAAAASGPAPPSLSGRAPNVSEPLPSGVGGVRERVRKRYENQLLCQGTACEPLVHGRALQVDAARRCAGAVDPGRRRARPRGPARGPRQEVAAALFGRLHHRRFRPPHAAGRGPLAGSEHGRLLPRRPRAHRYARLRSGHGRGPRARHRRGDGDRDRGPRRGRLRGVGALLDGLRGPRGRYRRLLGAEHERLRRRRRPHRRRVARLLPARLQRPRGQAAHRLAEAEGDGEAGRPRGARAQGLHARPRRACAEEAQEARRAARAGPDRDARRRLAARRDGAAAAGPRLRARARQEGDEGAGRRRVRHARAGRVAPAPAAAGDERRRAHARRAARVPLRPAGRARQRGRAGRRHPGARSCATSACRRE